MYPAPYSYYKLVPVCITIGFPPEREPFPTEWAKIPFKKEAIFLLRLRHRVPPISQREC